MTCSVAVEEFAPDAIISATSNFGVEVLEYLKKTGKNVKLVTFDDNKWFELCGITAIRQNDDNLSETAFEMINGDNAEPRAIVLKQTLICRN